MKVKFNKFERVAGMFVAASFAAAVGATVFVAVKQGWFAARIKYRTTFENAQGIFPGTRVEMAGLKVGSVDQVEFLDDNKIVVTLSVFEKFSNRIRADSLVRTSRTFVIGDKLLDITVGTSQASKVAANGLIPSEMSFDLIEMFDGRKLGPYFQTLSSVTENLKLLAQAFMDPSRTKALIQMFDRVDPLLKNANRAAIAMTEMAGQMTKDQNLQVAIENLALTTGQLAVMIQEVPTIGKDMAQVVKTTGALLGVLNDLLPMVKEMAPELPRTTRRAVEALDETVIVLKAMQKSFLLSGKVEDVKKEEAERDKKRQEEAKERAPAGEKP